MPLYSTFQLMTAKKYNCLPQILGLFVTFLMLTVVSTIEYNAMLHLFLLFITKSLNVIHDPAKTCPSHMLSYRIWSL